MHELPVISRLLEIALAHAPEGSVVSALRVSVGALCDADPVWLERYFRIAARNTRAENAVLSVTKLEPANGPGGPMDGRDAGYTLDSIEVTDSPGP